MKLFAGIVVASVAAAAFCAPAMAEQMIYKVALVGTSETPPNDSKATGTADVTVDTGSKKIAWVITSKDLSGDATAAHFHAPAVEGQKADPVIDISKSIQTGNAPITDAQIADLKAGKMYLNIHSAKFPGGEIRGQLKQ